MIVATHIPFTFKGEFWGKPYPPREYGIVARIDTGTVIPGGISINAGSPTRSIRTAMRNGETVLIVVDESHKGGEETGAEQHFRNLEDWSRERFGVTEFENRWSSQDYFSLDGLPFAGRTGAGDKHTFVATAFRVWGLSNGTAAAMLLSDLIAGEDNE